MSLANVPHGHATPAAQGHFLPMIVPFSIQKLDGEERTPLGTASDGEGTSSSPALPPQMPQPQSGHSPNSESWKKYVDTKNSQPGVGSSLPFLLSPAADFPSPQPRHYSIE